jgi:uncharacterized protein DUF6572/type VI secretion system (T6SS) immunity protein Tdi1
MTIEQRNVVDFISMRSDGRAVLTVSDHLDWVADRDHLLALQSKLNDYLAFIESGEIYDAYPGARGKDIEIQVVLKHSPSGDGVRFLERAREAIVFQLDWNVDEWVEAAEATLGPLAEGQCYGFKAWPVLGGAYAAENMTIKSLTEWLAVSGAIGGQVRDLPDGSQITLER